MTAAAQGVLARAFLVFVLATIGFAGGALAAGEGERCAGVAGIGCDEGLWCDPDPGACGLPDVSGTCVAVPDACTMQFDPVCGCDKKTYSNNCARLAARAALDHAGECKE